MDLLLGIDIGTSGTKTCLFQSDGTRLAAKTVEYPLYQPQNGWAEQDPGDWWSATAQGIRAVLRESGARAEEVRGVGLSGQMHGLVMLDAKGGALRRSIIWCDQRTGREAQRLEELIGREKLISITANPPLTGFTAAKILWVKQNEPELYRRCAHILLPKDYIRYRLTGEFATEVSDASGMQLMDVPNRRWSSELLDRLEIDSRLLGKMYESPDVTGLVSAAAASETGLSEGTPVVGGAADNAAAAIGTGVVSEGTAFTTLGTSGVVYAVSDAVSIDPEGRIHTLCASVPGKWTVMSCTQAAGLSLQWVRNQFCQEEIAEAERLGVDPYALMDREAEAIPTGSDRLIYLPYLMGERSPHPDPDCRGVFLGLSAMHTRAHVIRAVMEGVAYSQRDCVDVFRGMGVSIREMMVCGGGGRSRLWRQMLADLYGCPVSTLQNDEGPALGAAILAGVGVGVYDSIAEACAELIHLGGAQKPSAERTLAYEPYVRIYKGAYLALKESFSALARL